MLFGTQAIRLLRDSWKRTKDLAEELYAMFQDDIPLEHNAPITITTRNSSPPLTIRNFGDGDFSIKIIKEDGTPGGGIGTDDDGNPVFKDPNGDPVPNPQDETPEEPGAGACIPGCVTAQASGQNYSVDLYENGPEQASTRNVTVRQLQIHADDTIPAGTWALVCRQLVTDEVTGDTEEVFSMQVPIWL